MSVIQPNFDEITRPDIPVATIPAVEPSNHTSPPDYNTLEANHAFALSDVVNENDNSFEPWPAELAGVDINIAPDSSYIETSSGPAARELKRRYDQRYGVNVNVRSPYAITAFVNQHGKQMFRVGHRELSAPAASSAEVAAEVEERTTQSKGSSEVSHSPRSKRRSRLSMHTIFPPGVFTKAGTVTSTRPLTSTPNQTSAPKKLRKARSISEMGSVGGEVNEHGELPPSITGRAHSQSVTAADMPRYTQPLLPDRKIDMFGEVMNWLEPSSSGSPNFSSTLQLYPRPLILHPFGTGVTFESPLKQPLPDGVPPSRHLRLMQSFESGLTARQDDPSFSPSSASTPDVEENRPPSAIRITDRRLSFAQETSSRPPSTYEPPAEASMLTQYATTVFDVLQTYRGLPNLEKLSLSPDEGPTVRMSLSKDQSAAPRDDPRFVIWGEHISDWDQDDYSASRDSIASEFSSSGHVSSLSKRRTSKASKTRTSETASRVVLPGSSQRILVAATIERWIAQLTSDLNYDELLDFFLTYRTYISGVDLCHLLISRFHWALQQPTNAQDETVRRIVRVRTFVAIRYWLLTFFTVDFTPNRELRLLMSDWLNKMIHDPLLKKHVDGLNIVRRLAKVAKECKRAHDRSIGVVDKEKEKPKPKPEKIKTHVLGQKFAEAVLKDEDEDSDVDLDFLPEESTTENPALAPNDPANSHLSADPVGAVLSPSRPSSLPLSSFNILQRIDQAPGPVADVEAPITQTPPPNLIHNSALSRAFVKTIGRLGRLKRVLHSRSSTRTSITPCVNTSGFDPELSVSKDLLATSGGIERLFKAVEAAQTPALPSTVQPMPSFATLTKGTLPTPPALPIPSNRPVLPQQPLTPTTPTQSLSPESPPKLLAPPISPPKPLIIEDTSGQIEVSPPLPTPPPEEEIPERRKSLVATTDSENDHTEDYLDDTSFVPSQRMRSVQSYASSTGSFGEILDGNGSVQPIFNRSDNPWQFDVVSIDDLDFSDTSSDFHAVGPSDPPGLRKAPRKLPMRKDFEFLPRRSEVSSMGIISRASVASGPSSSAASSASLGGLGGNVQQWQLNALLDSLSNDEEDGDVSAALRRLEGQINPKKMQEKRSKVDGWVRQIQERLAAGDYTDEAPRFPVDSDEEDEKDSGDEAWARGDDEDDDDSASQRGVLFAPPGLDPNLLSGSSETNDQGDGDIGNVQTPVPEQKTINTATISSSSSEVSTGVRSTDAKPAVEDVVPLEILQSRVSVVHQPEVALQNSIPDPSTVVSKFSTKNEGHQIYQSFILNYRALTLAQQFSMIDRELFMGVKFEELVTEEWMGTEEVDVYDWSQYLKDRARWKAENRNADKTTALAALRARFNLMANFVISEILLTHPQQRSIVVGKFIRIAWKCYELSNFNTLVSIITALQSDWVSHAMKKSMWNRVGSFETRIFRDLKIFVFGSKDFQTIRRAVESIVDSKPLEPSSHAPSVNGGAGQDSQGKGKQASETRPAIPNACIPFIGIYLAQLARLKQLPDLIDPTSPNEAVGMNPATGDFDPPVHPEVFAALAPLPPTMRLEPLVNVHKQRKIAAVIKSLVAGQHLASRVNFEVDKRLFQRLLKIKALEPNFLQRASTMYSD